MKSLLNIAITSPSTMMWHYIFKYIIDFVVVFTIVFIVPWTFLHTKSSKHPYWAIWTTTKSSNFIINFSSSYLICKRLLCFFFFFFVFVEFANRFEFHMIHIPGQFAIGRLLIVGRMVFDLCFFVLWSSYLCYISFRP